MVDDINYKWDSKYIKSNIKNLGKNLEWLRSLDTLEGILGEGKSDVDLEASRELLIKLDLLSHIDKLEEDYDNESLVAYLDSKHLIMESILPYIPRTGIEFRRKYLISNPFIQYLFMLVSSNFNHLNTEILVKYFNFLLHVDVEDTNDLLLELYIGIYNSHERGNLSDEERTDTRVKLLSKIVTRVDTGRIAGQIQECLIDSFCNNRVFYNNVNELLQIIYHYYNVGRMSSTLGMSNLIGDGRFNCNNITNDTLNNFIGDYIQNYIDKLGSYLHILSNNNIIRVLYFLYKINYSDSSFFNKLVESVIYKFDTFTYDQLELVMSLIPSYKYLFLLNGGDLGDSVYSEGSNMLISMLREYFENKLVNVQLTRMVEPLTALTMISSKNNRLKGLVLKKIDWNMFEQLNEGDFGKMLVLLNNLRLNKSNEYVTRLINKYVSKYLLVDGYSNFDFINSDTHSILNILSRFMPQKKYSKFLSRYVTQYLDYNTNSTMITANTNSFVLIDHNYNYIDSIVSLLGMCVQNKLYKFKGTDIINKLLAKFISTTSSIENSIPNLIDSSKYDDGSPLPLHNSIGTSEHTTNLIDDFTNNIQTKDESDITNILARNISCNLKNVSITSKLNLASLVTLLEAVDHCNLSLNNVYYITGMVYEDVYRILSANNRWNMTDILKILGFIVNTRIVDDSLLGLILDHIYNYYVQSILDEGERGTGVCDSDVAIYSKRSLLFLNSVIHYLKFMVFLDTKSESNKTLKIVYKYVLDHLNHINIYDFTSNRIGKQMVENVRELLVLQKFKDHQFYDILTAMLRPEVYEILTNYKSIFRLNKGKLGSIICKKLGSGFLPFYEIEGFTLDFYSEKINQAVHILKKQHYYVNEGKGEVYLKHRARIMEMIGEGLHIRLKLVPEHFVADKEFKIEF